MCVLRLGIKRESVMKETIERYKNAIINSLLIFGEGKVANAKKLFNDLEVLIRINQMERDKETFNKVIDKNLTQSKDKT